MGHGHGTHTHTHPTPAHASCRQRWVAPREVHAAWAAERGLAIRSGGGGCGTAGCAKGGGGATACGSAGTAAEPLVPAACCAGAGGGWMPLAALGSSGSMRAYRIWSRRFCRSWPACAFDNLPVSMRFSWHSTSSTVGWPGVRSRRSRRRASSSGRLGSFRGVAAAGFREGSTLMASNYCGHRRRRRVRSACSAPGRNGRGIDVGVIDDRACNVSMRPRWDVCIAD